MLHLSSQVAKLTKELNDVKTRTYGVPLKSARNGTLVKDDMFEGVAFIDDVLSVPMKDKVDMVKFTKECPSPCSAYSVIVDSESSTSMGLKDTSVYERNSLDHLQYSCLSRGWDEESLLATHGLDPSTYNTLQPQELVLDELPLTNAMIHTTTDWLWESTT